MPNTPNENQIQLALQAMGRDKSLSARRAAALYSVPRSTLVRRQRGKASRADTVANSRNLDPLEEEVIVRGVLDLNKQGFSPGLSAVEDMANLLRETRGASRVGPRWASNFETTTIRAPDAFVASVRLSESKMRRSKDNQRVV
jgi:hypothetical protein